MFQCGIGRCGCLFAAQIVFSTIDAHFARIRIEKVEQRPGSHFTVGFLRHHSINRVQLRTGNHEQKPIITVRHLSKAGLFIKQKFTHTRDKCMCTFAHVNAQKSSV